MLTNSPALIGDCYNDAIVSEKLAKVPERNSCRYHKIFLLIVEEVEQAHKWIYSSLGQIMWMEIDENSFSTPFKSYTVKEQDGRLVTVSIDTLSEVELQLFASLIDENRVTDARVKARLADILWLRRWTMGQNNPRQYADIAIDAYRTIPLTYIDWVHGDGRKCWSRALKLAIHFKDHERINSIIKSLLSTFNAVSDYEDRTIEDIARILFAEKNRLPNSTKIEVARKLEKMAEEGMKSGLRSACDAIEEVKAWYAAADMKTEANRLDLRRIEWMEAQADELVRTQDNSRGNPFIGAVSFYEASLGLTEKLPKQTTNLPDIQRRLRIKLRACQQKMPNSMRSIERTIDMAEEKEWVSRQVSGVDKDKVLARFVELSSTVDSSSAAHVSLLDCICTKTYCDKTGRTVRRDDVSNTDAIVNTVNTRLYGDTIKSVTETILFPAYEIVKSEHVFQQRDFASLVEHSLFLPEHQRKCWTNALWCGWQGHFFEAELFIAPLMESLVRSFLSPRGVKVSYYRKEDNAEQYEALGSLMKQVDKEGNIMLPELSQEIKDLFCDTVGPNVRNVVAHGLFDDDEINSFVPFYAWFFALRLVMKGNTCITLSDGMLNEMGEAK